jgi:antitoxin component YwqK of YwqJK toxin-antitoxin module
MNKISIYIVITLFLTSACSFNNKEDANNEPTQTEVEASLLEELKKDPLLENYEVEIVEKYDNGNTKLIQYYDKNNRADIKYERKYHETGNISMEGGYENGKRHGKWRAWYPNGVLWSSGIYDKGLKVGSRDVYYENGMLRYSINYVNDKAQGTSKHYNAQGDLVLELKYENDTIVYQKEYAPNHPELIH